jgi:uncharacterized protein YceK
MRKLLLALFIMISFSACQSAEQKQKAANLQKYNAYYTAILNNDKFQSFSDLFDITTVMNKLSETEYRYDVIIDNPRVAMYDIEVLVIVNDKSLQISKEVMPSIGIFETGEYNLVPYQVNMKSGYSKGFGLSGTVKTATVELKALVLWYDYAKVSQQREYFDLNAQYSEEIPG